MRRKTPATHTSPKNAPRDGQAYRTPAVPPAAPALSFQACDVIRINNIENGVNRLTIMRETHALQTSRD